MKRFFTRLAVAAFAIFALCSVVKLNVNAVVAGDTVVVKGVFTSGAIVETTQINAEAATSTSGTFSASGYKTSGISFAYDGGTATKGVKLNSTGFVKFTPAYKHWSVKVWAGNATADSASISVCGTSYNFAHVLIDATAEEFGPVSGTGKLEQSIARSGSKESTVLAVEITYTIAADDFGTAYEVSYYDGATLLSTEQVDEGGYVQSIPSKFGYSNSGIYTDLALQNPFDDGATPITANIDLYLDFEIWDEINAYTLTPEFMTVLNTSENTSFASETAVPNSIYSIGNGCAVQSKTLDLPIDEDGSSSYYGISTAGSLQASKNYIKIVVPTDGKIVAYGMPKGKDARSALLETTAGDATTAITADAGSTGELADDTAVYSLSYSVSAGTYYLGGTNGIIYQYVSFIPTTKVGYQVATDLTSVRLVGQVAISDYNNLNGCGFVVTYNSTDATAACTSVYDSLNAFDNGSVYADVDGEYYFALAITAIPNTVTSFTVKSYVTIGAVTYYSTVGTITLR